MIFNTISWKKFLVEGFKKKSPDSKNKITYFKK